MAKMFIDGTRLDVDSVLEQILRGTLNGSKTIQLEEGEAIPSLPKFESDEFESLEIKTDEDKPIPTVNSYHVIVDFSSNYRDVDRVFTYSITLGEGGK